MKKYYLLFTLSLLSLISFPQITHEVAEKLADVCKYYGIDNKNIDSIFISNFVYSAENQKILALPNLYDLIPKDSCHEKPIHDRKRYADSLYNTLHFNANHSETDILHIKRTLQLKYDKLKYITYNFPQGNSIPQNEAIETESIYPSIEERLLSVFKFWNWTHYFYPYKNLIDESWTQLLPEVIVSVGNAKDSLEYQLAIREFVNRIDDAHSYTSTDLFFSHYSKKQVPLLLQIISDSIFIRAKLDPVILTTGHEISRGDCILELDYMNYNEYKNKYFKYCAASNNEGKNKQLGGIIKWTQKDTVHIKYLHCNDTIESEVISIENIELYNRYQRWNKYDSLFFLNDDIAYVDLSKWPLKSIPKLIHQIYNTKAIILDLRKYPEWTMFTILDYLPHDTITPTFALWEPTKNKPGHFSRVTLDNMPYHSDSLYNGYIFTLVNSFTQSRSEFYTMAMQICDNNITIGTKTAGADGDVSCIDLPGGIEACFSGIGIEYHDGRQTQQNGIFIDKQLIITPEDWKKEKDPYLKKAYKGSISKSV
jgi:C-terminal processing protease CtpA/Prc